MIIIKSEEEIEKIRISCVAAATILKKITKLSVPGITTKYLDVEAEKMINKYRAKPAFKGYRGYPSCICTSVNSEVVHGIPGNYKLKNGDIISIDLGIDIDNYYGDASATIPVGIITNKTDEKLIAATEQALYKGINKAIEGNRLFDISYAIQRHAEINSFSVVRAFVGHGIGRDLHEDPQIPNYGTPGKGPLLKTGMVLAIEPMLNKGTHEVIIEDDNWTVRTKDGQLSAHFEHTIAVRKGKAEILTIPED
jgi:methionyl aminopeptidase